MAVTIDQIRPPIKVQNKRNKQSFDAYAFTIDLVPLVLEKSCFAGQVFEYKWKISKRHKTRKRNADSTTKSHAKEPTFMHNLGRAPPPRKQSRPSKQPAA